MAQTGTTAPKQGRKTNAQQAAENRQPEEQLQSGQTVKNPKKGLIGLLVAILAVILICGLVSWAIWLFVSHSSDDAADEPAPTPASLEERGVGVVSGSWGEVKQSLEDPDTRARWDEMNVAMAKYRGFLIPDEAIDDHLVREVESADPERYVWTADRPLNGWLNTNWDHPVPRIFGDSFQVGDQFLIMEAGILAKYGVDITKIPAEALVALPDGTACVIVARAICTNHVWPSRLYANEDGDGDDDEKVKGPNPWPDFIGDHQASVSVPPPTPGYTPGTAEEVTEEQLAAPIGGLDPTPVGTPGDDAGGVTPPGTTELPDGTVVETPPPPDEEPAPPPPLAEVPPGAVLPEPD